MSESYVDTKILECSQRSSVQFDGSNTSNNALFMNKVDEGMMLNPGDKVSLHSAVISQIGAGGNTIELKGNFLKRVLYEDIVSSTPYTERNDYLDSGYKGVLNREDAITLNNTQVERDLFDNNLVMGIEYYKSANGENCFSLPRRFAFSGTRTYAQRWTDEDNINQGGQYVSQVNGGIVETDYQRDRNSAARFNYSWVNNRELLKVRQDGKKFTVFHRLGTTFYNASATQPSVPNLDNVVNGNGSIDPAVARYWLHRELKEVVIPKGRRSADFISETFTEGLQNASDLEQYYYYKDENNNPSVEFGFGNHSVLGAVYKTDTYKPFNCHNGSTFSEANYNDMLTYDHNTNGSNVVTQSRLDWVNGFQYIAFKRPDLVFPARQYWNSGGPSGDFSNGQYQHITNVNDDSFTTGGKKLKITFLQHYNETNCRNMSKFIRAQGLYPELWDFRNASSPYYDRKEVSTQIQVNYDDIPANATAFRILIDPGDEPLSFTLPRESIIKRTITVRGPVAGGIDSLEPAVCNVTSISVDASGFQTVYIDGKAKSLIPSGESFTFTITDTLVKLTPDNSRFVHIDMIQAYDYASKTLAVDRKDFGSDLYHNDFALKSRRYSTCSEPLWVTYIKDQEDQFFDEPVYDDREKKLSFGIFTKGPSDRIQIVTEGVGGVPEHFYNASKFFIGGVEAVENGSYQDVKHIRFCGYDPHFTAYGNAALGLYTPSDMVDMGENLLTGMPEIDAEGVDSTQPGKNLASVINQIYLGSSNPKLTYDPTKDRFAFNDFYTPEYLGNDGGAGQGDDYPANSSPQVKVYKINKKLRRTAFCPGMAPYPEKISMTLTQTDSSKTKAVSIDTDNRNIFPFSIMDCHSGISIDHVGITEDIWENSLLGILGFSYEQLNASVNVNNTSQNRVNTFNVRALNKLTTSAEIKAEDTLFYHQNVFGNTLYQPNVLASNVINDKHTHKYYSYNAPISVDSPSLPVTADSVPRSMLFPFYTIKSDLIDVDSYRGGGDSGQRLPVVGHVTKSTLNGDFFVAGDSSVEFTVTKSKPITSITTAIVDPDGSFSELNDNSAVLYKIQKAQQLPINILAEIMKGQK
jgi:hypothetical protein